MPKLLGFIILFILLIGKVQLRAQDMIFVHFGIDTIRHILELKMDDSQLDNIHNSNKDIGDIKASRFVYNGKKYKLDEIKLLGKTSLKYRRKSYEIALDKKMSFRIKSGFYKPKDFYLISLSQDKNHFRNRMSFQLLKEIGIFELFHDYVILRINGQYEGLYMLIQRPEDWAIKRYGSPYILKHGIDMEISKEKYDKEAGYESTRRYHDQFIELYNIAEKYQGKKLYKKLNKIIDLEAYYKLLAYNFWVMNGDYSDELYLYIDPETQTLKPVAWDYDEIFASPSDGGPVMDIRPSNRNYMFSVEDQFDQYLYMDEYCNERYMEILYRVLNTITPEVLWKTLIETYSELFPYYLETDIIVQTQFDKYGETNLEELEKEMSRQYEFLIERRRDILKKLEQQLNKKFIREAKN